MIVTILELILGLIGALALSGVLIALAVLAACGLTAGGCWYGYRLYRNGRGKPSPREDV